MWTKYGQYQSETNPADVAHYAKPKASASVSIFNLMLDHLGSESELT
jgi:hypothetical protein